MLQKEYYNKFKMLKSFIVSTHLEDIQENLHSYNTIIIIASNMKPCAGIDKGRIPTLQYIVRIN